MTTRNMVPRVNGEGSLGTSKKMWGTGNFKELFVESVFTKGQQVNVMAFGAKGDGITDDTVAINNANSSLQDGGVLLFPPGYTFIVSNNTRITKNNVNVYGYGSKIKCIDPNIYIFSVRNPLSDGTALDKVNRISSVKFLGLEIEGGVVSIALRNCDNTLICDCNCHGSTSDALDINYDDGVRVVNCITTPLTNYGVNLYQSRNFVVDKCRMFAPFGVVVKGSYDMQGAVKGIITNCHMECSQAGISSGSVVEEGKVKGVVVSNNVIVITTKSDNNPAIRLATEADEYTISNNKFYGGHISIAGSNNIITGNYVKDSAGAGVRTFNNSNANIIKNNRIYNVTAESGMKLEGSDCIVSGNIVDGAVVCGIILYGDIECKNNLIYGNTIKNTVNTAILEAGSATQNNIFMMNRCNGVSLRNTTNGSVDAFNIKDGSGVIGVKNIKINSFLIDYGGASPTTGTYKRGDIFYNMYPKAGDYIGWSCITGGSPGSWKGFGLIQA